MNSLTKPPWLSSRAERARRGGRAQSRDLLFAPGRKQVPRPEGSGLGMTLGVESAAWASLGLQRSVGDATPARRPLAALARCAAAHELSAAQEATRRGCCRTRRPPDAEAAGRGGRRARAQDAASRNRLPAWPRLPQQVPHPRTRAPRAPCVCAVPHATCPAGSPPRQVLRTEGAYRRMPRYAAMRNTSSEKMSPQKAHCKLLWRWRLGGFGNLVAAGLLA
jgi:hypothetical protein